MSSLENITTETISCLTFADSYTKKSGMYTSIDLDFKKWKLLFHTCFTYIRV